MGARNHSSSFLVSLVVMATFELSAVLHGVRQHNERCQDEL